MNPLTYEELKQTSISHTPSNLLNEIKFEKTLEIARRMLINEEWDETLQEYSINLLEELKKKYCEKWNSNWKYDAFLGYAYDIVLNYDERYASYKRAFEKVSPPPPELLVAIAGCCWAPGKPPITEEDSISLVKQAIKTTPYIEGVELLIGLYKSAGKVKEQQYWEKTLEKIKNNGPHLPSLDQIYE